jgi:uncharacterized protein (UPF0332 family)
MFAAAAAMLLSVRYDRMSFSTSVTCIKFLVLLYVASGELQEPSKKAISRVIEVQDQLVENAKNGTEDGQDP